MRFEEPLSKIQLFTLRNWVKRRLKKEPLQYITGSCDFYGREFLVAPKVLIPRPETERLIEESIKSLESFQSPKILDIGTGSGCIGITLAKEIKDSLVVGLDKSSESIQIAEKNSIQLNVNNISFTQMDILKDYPKDKFDLVISNPPYIPKNEMPELMEDVRDFEPEIALTDFGDGLTFYKRFVKILPNIVSRKSLLVVEVGIGDHPDNVLSILKESGYSDIKIINDYNGDRRVFRIKIKN
tara:strand:- start:1480 stop:2202 length:723 start_codon:yes stop_codon:yes gene_type:complete